MGVESDHPNNPTGSPFGGINPDGIQALVIRIDERQQAMEVRQKEVQQDVKDIGTRFLELIEAHQKKDEAEMVLVNKNLEKLNNHQAEQEAVKSDKKDRTATYVTWAMLGATIGWETLKAFGHFVKDTVFK